MNETVKERIAKICEKVKYEDYNSRAEFLAAAFSEIDKSDPGLHQELSDIDSFYEELKK